MKGSKLHEVILDNIKKHGVADMITGEVYIRQDELRNTLGRTKIGRPVQILIIKELLALGLLERINRDNYKVVSEKKFQNFFCKSNK